MIHTKPMSESQGEFTEEAKGTQPCRKCGGMNVQRRVWESSCGGYEDYKYICKDCGYVRWVDGPDS